MSFKLSRDWMQAALDGELSPAERAQFEQYLAESPKAQAHWTSLNEVDQLLSIAPLAVPQPGFNQRFQERLAKRRPPTRWWNVLGLGIAIMVGLALTVLFAAGDLLPILLFTPHLSLRASALTTNIALRLTDIWIIFDALMTSAYALGTWALNQPFIWLTLSLGLVSATVWLYLIRKLTLEVRAL